LAILILIIVFICYVKFILPGVGKPESIKVEINPQRLERGKYLANSVLVCIDCHSKRDWNKFAGPLIENTLGQGGEEFSEKYGFPGKYYAKNITPFVMQNWSDGEFLRAISCGVNKNGKALFPVMPYPNYGKLDREDLYSVIAYIRTLKPINHLVPESKSDFPMNFIINMIPRKAEFSQIPDNINRVAYGSYLFTACACKDCHTRQVKGKTIPGMDLAGGFEMPLLTGGTVRSANITQDKETGIGNWTEAVFLARFKLYADSTYKPNPINPEDFNTFMPWSMYGSMKSDDLKAMFAFLKTVKPVKNSVIKFTPKEN